MEKIYKLVKIPGPGLFPVILQGLRRCLLAPDATLLQPQLIPFGGRAPVLADDAWIAPGATLIGDVEVGSRSSIWFGSVLRGDLCGIRVGERSNVQDGTIIHVTHTGLMARIGDDVLVGHGCLLHGCTVESGGYVGMRSTMLDESRVESGGMLAAGALLAPGKCVRSGEVWAGVPARFLRKVDDAERAEWSKQLDVYLDLMSRYQAK